MGLAAILDRTWNGISALIRSRTATALFRQADRYRNEGRYTEAIDLVAQGLAQVPDSSVGHLLSAYLHIARRETDPARSALLRVLTLDPHHPRALLGLARVLLEEGKPDEATPLLDKALRLYPDFPEAHALRDMVGSWPSGAPAARPSAAARPALARAPEQEPWARALVATRTDGSLVHAGSGVARDRSSVAAQHLTQTQRIATATLGRAGGGPLHYGVIETGAGTTVLVSESGLCLAATVDGRADIGVGLARLKALSATLEVEPAR